MSQEPEPPDYVHGYSTRESRRLLDQARSLADLLLGDTAYPPGASVLEAGCGIGAQTVTLARQSPEAEIVAVDIARDSLAEAKRRVEAHALANVTFHCADIFALPFAPASFDHVFVCFVLEHLREPVMALAWLREVLTGGILQLPSRAIFTSITFRLEQLAKRRSCRRFPAFAGMTMKASEPWQSVHSIR
jgi:ubiquinone/menaquinone biosynthesis C-methylase UbiE